ncbi:MAG: hypothetical protein Q9165_004815 [Trypethelium subeluteriae]
MAAQNSAKKTGILTFNSLPPRLHITAETDDFDEDILQDWRDEGFDVTYFSFGDGGKPYRQKIQSLHSDLELGESYAIIAYGDPAAVVLDVAHKPMPHLCALIAYYPPTITQPKTKFPPHVEYQIHLSASQQGRLEVPPDLPVFWYPDTREGFAESDLDEWDGVASGLAWTRTLGAIRTGFKIQVDLENVWEKHQEAKYQQKSPAETIQTMSPEAYVNHVPTMTGGTGSKELFHFYKNFFMPGVPPSFKVRLISRTAGIDRVVDEMFISFKHTQEIPWMLPDVPPTNKNVEIVLVSIACVRGGKIYQESVYWDQASVLVQIGLLDPKFVPKFMKAKGLKRLPVTGAESTRKVLNEDEEPSNGLLSRWQPPAK